MKNKESKYISLNKEIFNNYFNIINNVKSKIVEEISNECKNKEDLDSKEDDEN